jgi:integration host factor subunit alpha
MTLKKTDIISTLHEQTGIPKSQCGETLDCLVDLITNSLADGEEIQIRGFGTFKVEEKKERKGRNPATGEEIIIPERKRVAFKYSNKLKERLNGV